ncbi:17979_t:CDS:10 [Acaulospora morrowiae]|uniref:17979_t:CDS:1 n=1 Tax=Acaulospora morrowiae TaxID=94023 RepID=A0A9N9CWE6_9GLOM|nr:17979_t:CDS:10 [Acaulospora morrowiae]
MPLSPDTNGDNKLMEKEEPAESNNKPRVPMSQLKLNLLFIGLLFGVFLSALNLTIVSTALQAIASDLSAFDKVLWVAIADLLTATAFQPVYGKLSDIFGRKITILTAIFIFELGSLFCGLADNITKLVLWRAVSGIGAGGFIGLTSIIIADIISLKDRGKYVGIVGSVYSIGSIIGPLLGGAFTDHVSWRWVFYINLPFGVIPIAFIVFLLNVPTPPGTLKEKLTRIDWLGMFVITSSTLATLLALQWGGSDYAWNSALVIILFVLGGLGFILFAYIEGFIAVEPIIPVRLFRDRTVVSCSIQNFFYSIGLYECIFFVPLFFQAIYQDSALASGIKLLSYIVGVVISALISGQVVSRAPGYSYKLVCLFGGAMVAIGSGLIYTLDQNSTVGQQVGYLLITGFGAGSIFQISLLTGQAVVDDDDIAIVTSLITFFRSFGSVIGMSIFSAIVNNELIKKVVDTFKNQYGFEISFNTVHGNLSSVFSFGEPLRSQLLGTIIDSLHKIFLAGLISGVLLFISALFMRNYIETEERENEENEVRDD